MGTDVAGQAPPPPRLVCRTTQVEDPSVVESMIPKADLVWLSPGTRLAAFGGAWRIEPLRSPDRFNEASTCLQALFGRARILDDVDLPGSGPVAFGAFSFDWQDAGSLLIVPSLVYGVNEIGAWKTEIRTENAPGGSFNARALDRPIWRRPGDEHAATKAANESGDFTDWQSKFEKVLRSLEEGRLQKLVLARKAKVAYPAGSDGRALLKILSREFPGCYTFYLDNFIGATPELLVRRLGQLVDSMPIAGSAPRSDDESTDTHLGAALMASAKNQREHDLTRQAVVSALEPFCSSLEVEPEPSLLLLSNVQHLSTKVQGRLAGGPDCMQLVAAMHPTPAVCGVPPEDAMETIRSVEGFSRGRYAGPIGWMDHRGDGEWAIALRCADLSASSATLYAGAGIVAGSDLRSEFDETELKLRAMQSALARLRPEC